MAKTENGLENGVIVNPRNCGNFKPCTLQSTTLGQIKWSGTWVQK